MGLSKAKSKNRKNLFAEHRTKFIKSIEESKRPLWQFILLALGAIILRLILEPLSTHWKITLSGSIHFIAFYLLTIISIIIIISIISKNSLSKTAKISLPFLGLTILPPSIDLALTNGKGLFIGYLSNPNSLLIDFFTLGGDPTQGISLGIKVEFILIISLIFYYFIKKKVNLIRSVIGVIAIYSIIFFYFASPLFCSELLKLINLNLYDNWDYFLTTYFFILTVLQLPLIIYIQNKKLLFALIKDIRPTRMAHFVILMLVGVFIALRVCRECKLDSFDFLSTIFLAISIFFAFLFSIIQNNIHDRKIDEISNKNRPLQLTTTTLKEYSWISYSAIIISLVFALSVSLTQLGLILAFIFFYWIYSNPPLRLKRLPIISKFFISLNSIIMVFMGFTLAGAQMVFFPKSIIWLFLVGFTLSINFIDIKDYFGDKKAKINTLPVLLGLKKSKILISLFFVLAYAQAFFVIGKPILLLPIAAFALIEFILINSEPYDDRKVLIVYLVSLVSLASNI